MEDSCSPTRIRIIMSPGAPPPCLPRVLACVHIKIDCDAERSETVIWRPKETSGFAWMPRGGLGRAVPPTWPCEVRSTSWRVSMTLEPRRLGEDSTLTCSRLALKLCVFEPRVVTQCCLSNCIGFWTRYMGHVYITGLQVCVKIKLRRLYEIFCTGWKEWWPRAYTLYIYVYMYMQ